MGDLIEGSGEGYKCWSTTRKGSREARGKDFLLFTLLFSF